jgi:CheY-like chemotaxis protein
MELNRELPPIMADPHQITQAVLNLCVNARDAMPDGGRLTLKTGVVDGKSLQDYGETKTERCVCIEVADTGTGIDKSVQRRIFEPFFTTKETGKASGLGLAIVYGIVKSHNGFIQVESDTMSESRGTILVVEDKQLMLRLLEKVLSQQDFRVLVAADGEQAVELYRSHKSEIDVVLLDIGLPKIGGWEVFLRMKEENPNVRVVVASGYLEPNVKTNMSSAGVKHFVEKPYILDEVVESLRDLMTDPSGSVRAK